MANVPTFPTDIQFGTYVSPRFERGAAHLSWCKSMRRFHVTREEADATGITLEVPGIGTLDFVPDGKPHQHDVSADFVLPDYLLDDTGTRWWKIGDDGDVHYEAYSVKGCYHWPVHAKWRLQSCDRRYEGLVSLNPKDALLHKAGKLHKGYPCRSLKRILVRLFGVLGPCRFDGIEVVEGDCPSSRQYSHICGHCGVQVYEYRSWEAKYLQDGDIPESPDSYNWACLECGDWGPVIR